MTLTTTPDKTSTFAILHGITESDEKRLTNWLQIMQESAGHPLLMAALTLDMVYGRLRRSYKSNSERYAVLDARTFRGAILHDAARTRERIELYNEAASRAHKLNEELSSLSHELSILKLRIDDLVDAALSMRNCTAADRKDYMDVHGIRLEHNLKQLSLSVQHLQAKVTSLKDTVASLIPSVSCE